MKRRKFSIVILCALLILAASSCAAMYGSPHNRYSSSMVDYLYPSKEKVETPSIPRLSLPLSVGVAFVPENGGAGANPRLSEKDKMDLMESIAADFKALPFVKEIQLIPSAYLTPKGGFANLDQIATMYGIDEIALLSCDQVQNTDEGLLTFSYWTIVGAYVVKGEKNDTNTMMDAAVYDIKSRKLLFRAPGTSRIKGSATLVNLSEQLRSDSLEGFRQASKDLVTNLEAELSRFQAKIKESPELYTVEHKPGYSSTGGGALGGSFALGLLVLGGLAAWKGKKG